MKCSKLALSHALLLAAFTGGALAAEPDYRRLVMEIDVAKPAEETWKKVGGYCDIAEWLKVDCKVTSGDGGVGTVRDLAGGRVKEIMISQTPLGYGYTQPAVPGKFYDLYHGFMEARPVTPTTSKIVYTLVLDESDKADAAAKETDLARRKSMFETALKNMKHIAEAP
jgi:hypothetical protein